MSKKSYRLSLFSPLLLLLLLLLTPWVSTRLSSIATHSSTAALAYKFGIPLAGLSLGFTFFLLVINGYFEQETNRLHFYVSKNPWLPIIFLATAQAVFFSGLAIFRYNSLHGSFFDLAIELYRLWLAWHADISKFLSHSQHFQPLIYVYSFIYNTFDSPLLLFVLQSFLVTSSVIPLFLLARKKLDLPLYAIIIAIVFLIYPPVQYNSFNDLHLDHLYIPIIMWAFYFAEQEKYYYTLFFVVLSALVKEPLILGAAFFGLYLAVNTKKAFLGVFAIFLLMFFLVTFKLLPHFSINSTGESISYMGSYNYLFTSHKQFYLPVLKEIFKLKKVVYLIFLFLPLLFLPLLSPSKLLPALPLIAVSILSVTPEHSTVNSHYTVGVIPPVFVALIFALAKIKERWGNKVTEALLGWILIMTISFNIAHSPSFISVNFWDAEGAGGIYHYSQYQKGKHEKLLSHVINDLIPEDPGIKLNFHGKIAHAKLSSHYDISPFPQSWKDVNYILLDHTRFPMVMDKINKKAYWENVRKVENSGSFRKIYNEDGIVLYARINDIQR